MDEHVSLKYVVAGERLVTVNAARGILVDAFIVFAKLFFCIKALCAMFTGKWKKFDRSKVRQNFDVLCFYLFIR